MSETSFFLSKLMALWLFLKNQYDHSQCKKIIGIVSQKITYTWKNSFLHNFLFNGFLLERGFSGSIFGKINQTTLFEKTSILWHKGSPETSIFGYLKGFCQSILYLPMSSFGILFGSFGLNMAVIDFIKYREFTIISLLFIFLSVACFILFRSNIASLYNSSFFARFATSFFRLYTEPLEIDKVKPYSLFLGLLGFIMGMTSYFLSNTWSVLLLFGFAGAILTFYRTDIGIFALFFLLPLVPTKICLALSVLIVASFLYKLFINEVKLALNPMDGFVLLYAGILIYSVFMSFKPKDSLVVAVIYLLFLFVYMATKHVITTKKQIYTIIGLFLTSSILVAFIGIYQKLTGSFTVTESWIDASMFGMASTRIYSTLDNPNVLGEFLIFSIIVSFAILYANNKISYKLFGLGSLVVCGICMILTLSRGAWLGLIFAIGIFALIHDRRLILVGLLLLPFLPLVLPSSIIERFTSIGDMSDGSTSYRVGIWLASIQLIKSFWPVGIGLSENAFLYIYQKFAFNAVFASHSHNLYFQWIIDYGIVGFVILVGVVILFIKSALQAYQAFEDKYLKTITAALLAGMAGYLLQGMTDNVWYNYRIVLFFWLISAIINALYTMKERNYANEKETEV